MSKVEVENSNTSTQPVDVEPVAEPKKAPEVVDVAQIFGGEVADTANAKAAPRERPDDAPADSTPAPAPKKRGRPRKNPEATPAPASPKTATVTVDVSGRLDEARELIAMGDGLLNLYASSQLKKRLDNWAEMEAMLATTPAERDRLALPLARGLAEHGAQIPWYAMLGIAAAALYGPRVALVARVSNELDAEKAKRPA